MKFVALFAALLMLSGCALFEKDSPISQQEKVEIVFTSARAGTFAALQRIDDPEEKAADLIEIIETTVEPILDSEGDVGRVTSDIALSLLPSEYEIYLSPALTTLHSYY